MPDMTMTACGTMTRDPDLRFLGGGSAVANFRIAVSHRFKKNDEWEEETAFLDCSAFGSLGENIAASCHKGTRMIVTGRLKQREWEADDGGKRTVLELLCDEAAVSLKWATAEVVKNERKEARR